MGLSVIIITKNAATTLNKCLSSVAFADEIIVLDSGSSDQTCDIARSVGAKFISDKHWPGFGPQKNRVLDMATSDWVLSIDADEWLDLVAANLVKKIVNTPIDSTHAVAYEFPRQSFYLGRAVRHSGWWPDHVVRLFQRGHARFSNDLVHEKLIVDGVVTRLSAPLMHDAVLSTEQVIEKINRYSTESAKQMHVAGKSAGFLTACLRAGWAFFRVFMLQRGFLDGQVGFLIAVHTAETTFYRYIKLWQLRKNQ